METLSDKLPNPYERLYHLADACCTYQKENRTIRLADIIRELEFLCDSYPVHNIDIPNKFLIDLRKPCLYRNCGNYRSVRFEPCNHYLFCEKCIYDVFNDPQYQKQHKGKIVCPREYCHCEIEAAKSFIGDQTLEYNYNEDAEFIEKRIEKFWETLSQEK